MRHQGVGGVLAVGTDLGDVIPLDQNRRRAPPAAHRGRAAPRHRPRRPARGRRGAAAAVSPGPPDPPRVRDARRGAVRDSVRPDRVGGDQDRLRPRRDSERHDAAVYDRHRPSVAARREDHPRENRGARRRIRRGRRARQPRSRPARAAGLRVGTGGAARGEPQLRDRRDVRAQAPARRTSARAGDDGRAHRRSPAVGERSPRPNARCIWPGRRSCGSASPGSGSSGRAWRTCSTSSSSTRGAPPGRRSSRTSFPSSGCLLGITVLGEPADWRLWLGSLLVIAGILATSARPRTGRGPRVTRRRTSAGAYAPSRGSA